MNKILPLLREKEVCMNCKHCGAELKEEEQLCPVCGKSQTEEVTQPETEAPAPEETQEQPEETSSKPSVKPGAKPWQIVILTLVCVALLAGLAFMIIRAVNEAQKGVYDYPGGE